MRTIEDDVKKLVMLGVGDKYRLSDIKERMDMGKDLYISDKEFLENLSVAHLGRSLSRITKSQLVTDQTAGESKTDSCIKCGAKISTDEEFCTNCGSKIKPVLDTHEPEPSSPSTQSVNSTVKNIVNILADEDYITSEKKSRNQELEDYEKEYLSRVQSQPDTGGFTITEDGEVGESVSRKTKPRKKATSKTAKPRKKATSKTAKPRKKAESKTDSCVKCGAKISTDDAFCTNCGSKR